MPWAQERLQTDLVPEPMALLGSGLIGLSVVRKRSRRA